MIGGGERESESGEGDTEWEVEKKGGEEKKRETQVPYCLLIVATCSYAY